MGNIAEELYVAPATVRGYMRNIHIKYGVSSTAHATRVAIERGDLSFVLDEEPARTLTELELKSLEFASLGFTAVAAAEARNVSVNTIRTQQKSVLSKLTTHSITKAVRRGFELGYFCYPVKDSGLSALGNMALMSSAKVSD